MTGARQQIRVLVAEDDAYVRGAIVALIENEPAFSLIGAAEDAAQAIALAAAERPDVALVDVRMPAGGGPVAVRGIAKRSPETKVIALSAQSDRETVLEMLEAGVVGYLVKGSSVEEIVDSIHRAAEGAGTLSMELTSSVIEELAGLLNDRTRTESRREQRILRMRRVLDADDSFSMVFQPIVALADNEVVGAEALARFVGPPRRGPDRWFAEAERLGLREELELLAVRKALTSIPDLPDGVFLSVNVSPATLTRKAFHKLVASVDGPRLVVEITENAPVGDYERLGSRLRPLRARGVRVAIDDTGAGFASLTHLLRVGPEVIKLDRSLIEGIDGDRSAQALASGVVSFARRSGASVVAEGIERPAQLETLVELGVATGQGFCIARPAPLPLWRDARAVAPV